MISYPLHVSALAHISWPTADKGYETCHVMIYIYYYLQCICSAELYNVRVCQKGEALITTRIGYVLCKSWRVSYLFSVFKHTVNKLILSASHKFRFLHESTHNSDEHYVGGGGGEGGFMLWKLYSESHIYKNLGYATREIHGIMQDKKSFRYQRW